MPFLGLLAGAGALPAAAPASRTCIVDQTALVTRSTPAIALGGCFQQRRQALQGADDAVLATIASDARMLASLRASLPAAVARDREADLAARRLALQRRADAESQALAALNERLKATVLAAAAPLIVAAGRDRGCGVVLPAQGAVVIDGEADLTADVLQRMERMPVPADGAGAGAGR